mmetsp:Transcript_1442/g.3993  ORF Transcript_1442/g.3993 Transcript_1442/m.3993 type:complete len:138 (-) Transcript_1442:542-955(-)|eukprot:CAMPEP_0113560926 /NCGR_PEP_ID=MMETSP0015_2-20120614/19704_1 /TAXON_ID=2838 /ORGANISM="Odontella" /LENGTH=137 /DNA_ID=CAMNT_0000462689 /DNA_START=250 /DNA_END=663 /DNA_ORIENTATION=- /assembly_acc=CAM_ASM_000160
MSTGSSCKRPRDDPDSGESAAVVYAEPPHPKPTPMNIATISSGFEKGDFLVREEKGMRVYFDFFEEAFNYISNRGYIRMNKDDEDDWIQLMNHIHTSVKGGMRYNTGKLLMVMYRPIEDNKEHSKTDNSGVVADGPK